MNGVLRTRVGYTGGTTSNPTYHSLGDHTESIQIDFDPSILTYSDLLDIFWDSHAATQRAWSRQYMNAVFYANDEQKRLILESRDRLAERLNREIQTEILPLNQFYLAEDYHQKYYLQGREDWMTELRLTYGDFKSFVDSTAVARLNGYAGGHALAPEMKAELVAYGLLPSGEVRPGDVTCPLPSAQELR